MSKRAVLFNDITWVGNFYQKFEAMCHEVDDIVSQERIKYVEDHVQSVGKNVKKFCCNVKDLLPPSMGVPLKEEAQSADAVVTKSMLESQDNECSSGSNEKLLPQGVNALDSGNNSFGCSVISDGFPTEDKFRTSYSEELDSSLLDSHIDQNNHSFTSGSSDSFTEEDKLTHVSVSDPIYPGEDHYGASQLNKFVKDNHESVDELSIVTSPLIQKDHSHSETGLKQETVHDSLSDTFSTVSSSSPYSQLTSSFASSESTSNVALASSRSTSLLESYDDSEMNSSQKEGMTFNDFIDGNGNGSTFCSADQSSVASRCDLSFENNREDRRLFGSSSCSLPREIAVIQHNSCDEDGLKQENTESFAEVHHAVSCAVQRVSSHKKKLKNVFPSRKRLEKEYEQLARWCCDIDSILNQALGKSTVLELSPSTNSLSQDDSRDAEWELL